MKASTCVWRATTWARQSVAMHRWRWQVSVFDVLQFRLECSGVCVRVSPKLNVAATWELEECEGQRICDAGGKLKYTTVLDDSLQT